MKHALIAAALAAATLAAAPAVQAAPAAKKVQVLETQRLAASPAQVWAKLGHFTDLSWHPAVKGVTTSAGDVPGSIRQVDLGGPVLVEQLWDFQPGARSLTYRIMDTEENRKILPVTDYESTLTIAPAGKGSVVRWSSSFRPVGVDAAAAEKIIRGVYRGGLDQLPKVIDGK